MSYLKPSRTASPPRTIDIDDEDERRAWSERFCVSPDELRRIVEHVGPRVDRVEDYLRQALVVHV
jgi:hypothetical protein